MPHSEDTFKNLFVKPRFVRICVKLPRCDTRTQPNAKKKKKYINIITQVDNPSGLKKMSSIPKDERILLREINRSGVSAVIKSRRFPPFLAIFSPTHSQVDRCRDVKLIFAGKGVGETLNILVHRRSGRSRTATIYHSSPPDGKTYSLPPFPTVFFHDARIASRERGHEDRSIRRAGRITCQRATQTDIRS